MKIFSPDLIKVNYYGLDKKSCLQEMVEFIAERGIISSSEDFFKLIYERENIMSTGIGRNVAIPHARSELVNTLRIAVYVLEEPIEYDSLDGEPVKIVFLISVPENMKSEYMKLLSILSNFCRTEENRNKIIYSKDPVEVYNHLKGLENEI